MKEEGRPPAIKETPTLFTNFLIKKGLLLVCGGMDYILDSWDFCVMEEVLPCYLKELKEYTEKRYLFMLPNKIQASIEETGFELNKVKEMINKEMETIKNVATEEVENIIKEEAEKLLEKLTSGDDEDEQVLKTDIEEFDNLLGGFKKGQYIVIGARPSTGKTSLAITLILNIARHLYLTDIYNEKGELVKTEESSTPVGFLSMEMDKVSIFKRFICNLGYISSAYLFGGKKPTEEVLEREKMASKRMMELAKNIIVSAKQNLTISQLKAVARDMKNNNNIEILFIDYLSLIKADIERRESWENMAEISRELNALSKELNITVVVLSQLNREAEKSEPNMANIRNSGAIEQDADVVMFLSDPTRTETSKKGTYYSVKYKDDTEVISCEKAKPIKIDIAKNRNGEQGFFKLMFLGDFMKFVSERDCTFVEEFVNGVKKR